MMKVVRSFLFVATTLATAVLYADSYHCHIPASCKDIVAFSFKAAAVEDSIGSVPEGTILYFWDVDEQEWIFNSYEFGEWGDPDYTISRGEAFFVVNPSQSNELVFTVTGTVLTNATCTVEFTTNKWYLVGSAYPHDLQYGNYLECMIPPRYTVHSLNYSATVGDEVLLYDAVHDQYEQKIRTTYENGDPKWLGEGMYVSPTIAWDPDHAKGRGFWLKVAAPNEWVHVKNGTTCPE